MTQPSACPDLEKLAAYREGGLAPAERQAVLRHCIACGDCRRILAGFSLARGSSILPASRAGRRPAWAGAAAAALLVAVGWLGWRASTPPPAGPFPDIASLPELPVGALPAGSLGSPEAPRSYLAPGTELLLQAGGRVSSLEDGRRLRAEAGDFWLEASGPALPLELPGATLTLAQGGGALFVSLAQTPPKAGLLLREAQAGTSGITKVWILRGEAELQLGGRVLPLPAATRLLLGPEASPEGWTLAPIPSQELEALEQIRALAVASLGGQELVPPGLRLGEDRPSAGSSRSVPPVYRWVSVLKGREPSAELELTLGIGGAWYRWTVGLAAQPPRPREVVEVVWDGERLKGRVNGRQAFSLPRQKLEGPLSRALNDAWSLSVWGGSVTVEQSVLQETTP